jgi:hypothetical protein
MRVESECGLTARDIIDDAFSQLERQLESVERLENVEFDVPDPLHPSVVHVSLLGRSATVSALIQAVAYETHVRGVENGAVSFIGRFEPHPLQDVTIIKLQQTISAHPKDAFVRIVQPVVQWVRKAHAAFG